MTVENLNEVLLCGYVDSGKSYLLQCSEVVEPLNSFLSLDLKIWESPLHSRDWKSLTWMSVPLTSLLHVDKTSEGDKLFISTEDTSASIQTIYIAYREHVHHELSKLAKTWNDQAMQLRSTCTF